MWADFVGKAFTREALASYVNSLTWTAWKPTGIVLHNTAAPTLAQWAEQGPAHAARIRNLQSYYEKMGWHGGPHFFVSRNFVTVFSNPLRQGTHSPSFNRTHFGIEMVGDYNKEEFASGDGALVRDNAVYLMALLCRKFGWDIAKVLKLHKEDKATTHDCPGKKVVKADVIARVQAAMLSLSMPAAPQLRKTSWTVMATEFGGSDETQESAYGGMVHGAQLEVSLPCKVPADRRSVRVTRGNKSVVCRVNDLGPWNKTDAYWDGSGVPLVESQFKNKTKAQNGRVPNNTAAIDLTPPVMDALGVPGKYGLRQAMVTWEFTTDTIDKPVEPELPPMVDPVQPEVPEAPEVAPPQAEPEPPAPTPAAPPPASPGFLTKVFSAIGGVFTSAGAALFYDWRITALVLFALVVAIALFVDFKKVRALVSDRLDRMKG